MNQLKDPTSWIYYISSQPGFISETQVTPEISDHQAIAFSLNPNTRLLVKPL